MRLSRPTPSELLELRSIASLQFRGVGDHFIPDNVLVQRSPSTYRIRIIYLDNKPLASLRAADYRLLLKIYGGVRLRKVLNFPLLRVVVSNKYSNFIAEGGNVFAAHVVYADPEIRPYDEVIVVNEDDEVIAVGRALLPGYIMSFFSRGEAVRVREGIRELV